MGIIGKLMAFGALFVLAVIAITETIRASRLEQENRALLCEIESLKRED